MRLESLTHDPHTFLHMERYVNEDTRTYSRFASYSEVAPEYRPGSLSGYFDVPCLCLAREGSELYLNDPLPELRDKYVSEERILFPVHPEVFYASKFTYPVAGRRFPLEGFVSVAPTASTRTVFNFSDHNFLKLHCPRRISRFSRRLRVNVIRNSIFASRELGEVDIPFFGYLPETIGAAYDFGGESWGFILRESLPRPRVAEPRYLIPLFALYARDSRFPGDPSLLTQLIEHHHADPESFVLGSLILPLIAAWCRVVRERGLILEMHGQNTLLELDDDLLPRRVIYRDLDVFTDPETRTERGLGDPFRKNRIGVDLAYGRREVYSLAYDSFLGHHLLDYLARALKEAYGIGDGDLTRYAREVFSAGFPDAEKYFGKDVFYYGDRIWNENKFELVPSGRPKWR